MKLKHVEDSLFKNTIRLLLSPTSIKPVSGLPYDSNIKREKMEDEISYQDINILGMNEWIRNKALCRSECYDKMGNKGY